MLCFNGFELDGNLFTGYDVQSEVDITWDEDEELMGQPNKSTRRSPKEPDPIFFPSLYFPPTRRSIWLLEASAVVGNYWEESWKEKG